MMRRFLFVFLALSLTACGVGPTSNQSRLRAYAEVTGETLMLKVTLEGGDGQSLSGAIVGLTDPGGAWQDLVFDSSKSAYIFKAEALAGEYKLETDSLLAGPKSLAFPVKLLSPSPTINVVQDGTGNDANSFQKLKASSPIRVEWQVAQGATAYLLEARQAGVTVLSQVVDKNSFVLPENTFKGSTDGSPATLAITATTRMGDAKFRGANYFSSSSIAGQSFTFQVVP